MDYWKNVIIFGLISTEISWHRRDLEDLRLQALPLHGTNVWWVQGMTLRVVLEVQNWIVAKLWIWMEMLKVSSMVPDWSACNFDQPVAFQKLFHLHFSSFFIMFHHCSSCFIIVHHFSSFFAFPPRGYIKVKIESPSCVVLVVWTYQSRLCSFRNRSWLLYLRDSLAGQE